jgi:hypothetical protein
LRLAAEQIIITQVLLDWAPSPSRLRSLGGRQTSQQAFAMIRGQTFNRLLCGCIVAVAISGCAAGEAKRYAVSGMVKWQGKPLDQGAITFLAEDPALGTSGGDMIKDGHYSIPASQGLLPGRYKVMVTSADPKNKIPDPDSLPGFLPVPKDRIQPKYNTQTTLTADVKAEGQNTFNFDVD